MRHRGQLLSHVQNTHHQYNLPTPPKRIAYRANREGVAEQFTDASASKSIEIDLELIGHYDDILRELEKYGTSGAKIGNVHLKWAFSEAAVLFLRGNPKAQEYFRKIESKHGKRKALSILAHRLGRAVYYLLKKKRTFCMEAFLAA